MSFIFPICFVTLFTFNSKFTLFKSSILLSINLPIGAALSKALAFSQGNPFCLHTACFYYELTTSIPSEIHVAIADDRRVALPDYPPIKLYYWNDTPLNLGITAVLVDNQSIQMYDLEKTICDVIRHRNKIGFETLKEILKNYLNRKDRDLNRLNLYAKQLNIQNKVDDFIKILL